MAADWAVNADPKAPAEALRFFRAKVHLTPAEFLKLRYQARQRAFTVAAATRLDQVNDIARGIERAIANGDSFETFKRGLVDKLGQSWGKKGYALEAVFRTNTQAAYSAGRWRGANRPESLAARPIGKFNALEDGRLCPICADCDGITLPLDDPWWQTHNPLLHMSCVAAEARITTRGGLLSAAHVTVGVEVMTHRGRWRRVTATLQRIAKQSIRRLHYGSGQTLSVSDDHIVLVASDMGLIWKRAGDLQVGNKLLQHVDEMGRTARGAVIDADNAPAKGNQSSISSEILLVDGERGAVPLAIQLYGDFGRHEGQIDDTSGHSELRDSLRKQAAEVDFRWGAFSEQSLGQAGYHALMHSRHANGIVGAHSDRTSLIFFAKTPVPSTSAFCDSRRISTGYGRSNVLCSHGDRVSLAPGLKDSLAEAKRSLDSAKALLADPVPSLNEVKNVVAVSEQDKLRSIGGIWHAVEITSIDAQSAMAHTVDFSVEEDESFVAEGVVVHNCRCEIDTLRPDEAKLTELNELPDVDVPAGFGLPADLADWEPDLTTRDADAGMIYQQRLEEADFTNTPLPPWEDQ